LNSPQAGPGGARAGTARVHNPLSMIDPSGFSWLSSAFRSIGNFISKYWRIIAAIVIAFVAPYALAPLLGDFAAAVATGMLAGGVATGTWQGALLGGLTGAIAYGAGVLAHSGYFGSAGSLGHAMVRAVAGCATSALGGGSCGQGAMTAAFIDYSGAKFSPMAGGSVSDGCFSNALEAGAKAGETTTLDGGTFGEAFREAQQAIVGFVKDQIRGIGSGSANAKSALGTAYDVLLDRLSVSANFNAAYGAGWTSQISADNKNLAESGTVQTSTGLAMASVGVDAALTVNIDLLRIGPAVNAPIQMMTSACVLVGIGICGNLGYLGNSVATVSIGVGVGVGAGIYNSVVGARDIRVFPSQ
jgi:hypothetical protein